MYQHGFELACAHSNLLVTWPPQLLVTVGQMAKLRCPDMPCQKTLFSRIFIVIAVLYSMFLFITLVLTCPF